MKNATSSFLLFFILLPSFSLAQVNDVDERGEMPKERVEAQKTSVFNYIYQLDEKPKITIQTNHRRLIKDKQKEVYQIATFKLEDHQKKEILNLDGRIRTRGNIRKKVCKIPPLKFDFEKSVLDSIGFFNNDKLKFVLPCNTSKYAQEKLLKEFFIYELYDQIDTNGIRVKLVDVDIINSEDVAYSLTGFLVEDEEEYMLRKNAIVIETAKLRPSKLERSSFLKMIFFQYMIANTDWMIDTRHNIELVKLPNIKKVIAVPYDFDYSGFVGQEYAMPHPSLPIEDVHDRYCFESCKISEVECDQMIDYFLSLEEVLNTFCNKSYLKENTIRENKNYLNSFFERLLKPKKIKRDFVKIKE